ncbi:hypothetical protein GCM10027569_60500 [Flindersiella endophytica]
MWDIDVIATGRHNDLLRRSAQRQLARRAKAASAAAARQRADLEPTLNSHRGASARRALGFALDQAGLWILVGGGRDVRDEQLEQLARNSELETARASAPHRS